MKKEEIYVNLQGKTKEELTDLWDFLTSNGEKPKRTLIRFLEYENERGVYQKIGLDDNEEWSNDIVGLNKTEVTIDQLKQIIKPMGTLQQQLQKAEAEVKRLQYLIEEENKPKVGDWVINDNQFYKKQLNSTCEYERKITNPELIKILENECSTKN